MSPAKHPVELMVPEHPMYATTLEHPSGIVKAAMEVAAEAHKNDIRKRKIGTFPYITHPIIVCKLLQKLGEDDSINLAVGLLHDVLEDNPEYKAKPHLMRSNLERAMTRNGVDSKTAKETAWMVFDHCKELCNPKDMSESKRTYQVEHVARMSSRSKLIKILDQTASVLEDIWFESVREPEKLEKFAMKGLNIAKAGEFGGSDAHLIAYQFYKVAFRYFSQVSTQKDPEVAAQMRAEFSVDRAMQQAQKNMESEAGTLLEQRARRGNRAGYVAPEDVISVTHPAIAEAPSKGMQFGVAQIELMKDENGKTKVCGYRLAIAPRKGESHPANLANQYLLGSIESFATRQRVTIHRSEVVENTIVRHFTIKPPMAVREFLNDAAHASEMTYSDMTEAALREGKPAPELQQLVDARMKLSLQRAQSEIEGNSKSIV